MKRCLIQYAFLMLCLLIQGAVAQTDYTRYVNPFIGTGGHGHTFPGAVLPFGMVQLSPDTRVDGSWDGCSGYHYSDSLIYGFSHTHLSGTGCSDWGDILLTPVTGAPSIDNTVYRSPFSHATEKATAGFYGVTLAKNNIRVELTTTLRAGIHRYTFPAGSAPAFIVDLLHRDKTLYSNLRIVDSVTITGCRRSAAWARDQQVFFAMKFSKPFKKKLYASGKKLKPVLISTEKVEGAWFEFESAKENAVIVKVAISAVSEEGALKNLTAEAPHWDFERYLAAAAEAWNRQLGKIEVKASDQAQLTVFYTAWYHCSIHPSLYMDVDRRYRGRDGQVHLAKDFANYTVFSLWDTYRALNPLFTILEPGRSVDFINTFLRQYQQAGRLPMWELSGNETDCMIAFHSVSVIADAMTKGLEGFDHQLAFEAMKAASNYSAYSIPLFNKQGFLQVDDESESVSKTLEYGYDNWCIAQAARLLGKKQDELLFSKRALAYKNVFDASTGCMRPRRNGGWLQPFSPAEVNNHFTEGNSWQYSFYVPHDVNGLIELHGGKADFEKKLDELFSSTEKNEGRDQADVTGLVGQYAHGNEPSHHMAYLYNYAGKPLKTIARVQQLCHDFYTNRPDGLIGNEDCGQMSAWYVFSAMGMYPVCPGEARYVLGAPLFDTIRLNLENGNTFLITKAGVAPYKNLTQLLVNGSSGPASAISHSTIAAGGRLTFVYGSSDAGYGVQQAPASLPVSVQLIPVPLIQSARVFKMQEEASITQLNQTDGFCVYTLDGTEPLRSSTRYTQPLTLKNTTTVKARVFAGKDSSAVITTTFHKIKEDEEVTLRPAPNKQYAAEGPQTLVDGIMGHTDWRKGDWLGFQGQDVECLVDLKQEKQIKFLALHCLQDTRAWIVLPARVRFYVSSDNTNYKLVGTAENPIKAEDYNIQMYNFEKKIDQPLQARYIKIVAENAGLLPEWHEGKGGASYIFTDELEVK